MTHTNIDTMQDKVLVQRVQMCVAEATTPSVDAYDVMQHLQDTYPQYKRRKRRVLLEMVSRILASEQVEVLEMPATKRAKGTPQTNTLAQTQSPASRINNSLRELYTESSPTPSKHKRTRKSRTNSDIDPAPSTTPNGVVPMDVMQVTRPTTTFADVGGCKQALVDMCRASVHLVHPHIYKHLQQSPPTGLLLHGPPGCGKTLLAQALAGYTSTVQLALQQLKVPLINVASPQLVAGVSGESESRIRDLFAQVKEHAPCVLLLDEIDVISAKRDTAHRDMERRIVAQLIACFDDMVSESSAVEQYVLVIGVTSRLDAIDPALRRAGRFDKEVAVGIPTQTDRQAILQLMLRTMCVSEDVNVQNIARDTPGFVGADLQSLCREANMNCVNRLIEGLQTETAPADTTGTLPVAGQALHTELARLLQLLECSSVFSAENVQSLCLQQTDFECALTSVQPSAQREGFITVPDTTWEQVGALNHVRNELNWSILFPIKYPEQFAAFGLNARAQGVMLCGPPGCGKTLLAKAVANESGMNFISVKGPELLSMYVGESERAVRQLFQRARNSAPCVVFFDEIDALCPRRTEGQNGGSVRVVNQLLTELDGMQTRTQVYVIAATNRPDMIDPAVLRPGRLDKSVYVGLPCAADRLDIIRALTQNCTRPHFHTDVDMQLLCSDTHTNNMSGADLAAVVREASVAALRDQLQGELTLTNAAQTTVVQARVAWSHLLTALQTVRPSVHSVDRHKYERHSAYIKQ